MDNSANCTGLHRYIIWTYNGDQLLGWVPQVFTGINNYLSNTSSLSHNHASCYFHQFRSLWHVGIWVMSWTPGWSETSVAACGVTWIADNLSIRLTPRMPQKARQYMASFNCPDYWSSGFSRSPPFSTRVSSSGQSKFTEWKAELGTQEKKARNNLHTVAQLKIKGNNSGAPA